MTKKYLNCLKELRMIILMILISLSSNGSGFSQIIVDSKAAVSNVDFNLVNDEFIITYDINNSNQGELFSITVSISTESGKSIDAKSFKGDIGHNISGGPRKKIIWEISKDVAFLDDKIFVDIESTNQNPKVLKPVSTRKALFLSTIYPGLGSSKTTLRNYHLLTGAAAYVSLSGSILLNNKSRKSLNDYDLANNSSDRDKYFKNYQGLNQRSKILMFTAGSLWVMDYIIILTSENRSQKKGFKSRLAYLGPSLNQNSTSMMMVWNF